MLTTEIEPAVTPRPIAAADDDAGGPPKPLLRGVLHQWAAVAAAGAGLVLVGMAPTLRAALAGGGFALSLVVLLTVSATYHRVTWSPPARARMRLLDHASIFLLIAGTYTPIALLGLPAAASARLLVLVWVGAAVGIAQSVLWISAPKVLTAALALGCGWSIAPYLGAVRAALTSGEIALILSGGAAYTLAALAYAAKRPRLRPKIFGYHEVMHALTIVGAVLHFVAVGKLVARA